MREEELTCKKKKKKPKTYAKEEVRSPWITTGMIEFLRWKGQEFIFLTLEPTCKCKSNRSQRPEGWLKGCGAVQKALEAWKLRCVCVCVCVCVYAHANTHQWWRIHTHSTGIYMRRLMYTYIFIQIHSVLLDFTDAVFFKLFFFYRMKACDNCVSSKSISVIFPRLFAHFMSLCHILVILRIFWTFSLLLNLLRRSVISDVTTATQWKLWWWLAFFTNIFN